MSEDLRRAGLERIVMGGHSFGGLLTYWLAANHPERDERCVVLDAPAVVDPTVVDQIQPALARLGRVHASWGEYVALVRAMPYFDEGGWDPDVEGYFGADVRVRPDGTVQARSNPENMEEAIRGTVTVDWPAIVTRIPQPTPLVRAPGGFGPPGSPPILSREGCGEDGVADPRLPPRQRGRQPSHVHVRRGGNGADRRDRRVPRRPDGVSGGYRRHVGGERPTMRTA